MASRRSGSVANIVAAGSSGHTRGGGGGGGGGGAGRSQHQHPRNPPWRQVAEYPAACLEQLRPLLRSHVSRGPLRRRRRHRHRLYASAMLPSGRHLPGWRDVVPHRRLRRAHHARARRPCQLPQRHGEHTLAPTLHPDGVPAVQRSRRIWHAWLRWLHEQVVHQPLNLPQVDRAQPLGASAARLDRALVSGREMGRRRRALCE